MPLVPQPVDVRGSLPFFRNLLGIAPLLSSAGPGTGVIALLTSGSCRFAHTCSACGADHRASICPGRAEKEFMVIKKKKSY